MTEPAFSRGCYFTSATTERCTRRRSVGARSGSRSIASTIGSHAYRKVDRTVGAGSGCSSSEADDKHAVCGDRHSLRFQRAVVERRGIS